MPSASFHRGLGRRFVPDRAMRMLGAVMLLPLIDGVFVALILAGALESLLGIIQIGVLVFGGSAVVAVIVGEMTGDLRDRLTVVLLVGVPVIVGSVVVAVIAPTVASLVDMATFSRFAALVIGAIAASTASARVSAIIPRPGIIIALGLIAGIDPAGFSLIVEPAGILVYQAAAVALVGITFAACVAILAPIIHRVAHPDRLRYGFAIALGVLSLNIAGVAPDGAAMTVLIVACVLAIEGEGASIQAAKDRFTDVEIGSSQGEREPWM